MRLTQSTARSVRFSRKEKAGCRRGRKGICPSVPRASELPAHQLLDVQLVVFEELLVFRGPGHPWLEEESLRLLLMLLGEDHLFQRGDQLGFDILRQSRRRGDAARGRRIDVEGLILEGRRARPG